MTTPRHDPASAEAQPIGLQDVLRFLRRGALLAILTGLVAGAAALVYTRNEPPTYRATVSLLASTTTSGYANLGLVAPPPIDPEIYQTAILEGPVAREALAQVDGTTPSQQQVQRFQQHIDVQLQKQTISSVIQVNVDSTDPRFAAAAANAISSNLVTWDMDRASKAIQRSIDALRQTIASLDNQIQSGRANGQPLTADQKQALTSLLQQRQQELNTAIARSQSSVTVGLLEPLSSADVPAKPAGPSVPFRTLVGFILGAFLAYALLFLRWTLDPRVHNRHEVAEILRAPVLAEFPAPSRSGQSPSVEAANFLRSSVMAAERRNHPMVLAITTLSDTTDKDRVSTSLAASMARAGYRTLLVDADLRHPSTTYGLDVSQVSAAPLEVYLENPHLEFAPVAITIGGKQSFDFVPSFTAAHYPVELLNRGLWSWLEVWREVYDVILVDCPPLLPFADTLTVAPMCTGLVLCSNLARTVRSELVDGAALLTQNDVHVVGAVLTNVRTSTLTSGGGGSHRPDRTAAAASAREAPNPYKTLGQEAANVKVRER